jgi:glycosyltransferase involved in cell wall biosynthesis
MNIPSIKVSFIIPVYNKEKYLNSCLDSIYKLSKNYKFDQQFEVLAINDYSSDNSLKILDKWKKKNTSLRIFNTKKNCGVSSARNLGIKKSKGEYIFFVDADDFIQIGAFKKVYEIILKNLSKDIFLFYSEINKRKYNKIDNNNLIDKSTNSYCGSLIKINNNFSSWNVWKMIVKRKFLIKNKIFFKNLFQFEDWVFIATIISKKPKYLLINKFVYSYRLTNFYSEGKKTSSRSVSNALKTYVYLIKINKKLKNKTIEKMITNIKIIIYIDLFALKKNRILKYKKNYPLLNHVFSKNLVVQNKIDSIKINYLNKFILFCAGRFGRAISLKLRNINQEIKVIIDNNPDYHNLKINNFTVKNQTYLSKNYKIFKDYKILICHMNKKIFTSVTSNIVSSRLNKRMIVKINIV